MGMTVDQSGHDNAAVTRQHGRPRVSTLYSGPGTYLDDLVAADDHRAVSQQGLRIVHGEHVVAAHDQVDRQRTLGRHISFCHPWRDFLGGNDGGHQQSAGNQENAQICSQVSISAIKSGKYCRIRRHAIAVKARHLA